MAQSSEDAQEVAHYLCKSPCDAGRVKGFISRLRDLDVSSTGHFQPSTVYSQPEASADMAAVENLSGLGYTEPIMMSCVYLKV